MKRQTITLPLAVLAVLAGPAAAHVDSHMGASGHGSFAAGFTHPLFGTDHLLAMVAVGLWASVLGGRALWALPLGFVGAMTLGFGLALAGLPLPMVEPMILGSVLLMGALVALAVRLPLGAGVGMVAALGLFHGHAHGAEMGSASALSFLAGFVTATALLHGAGVLAGVALARLGGARVTRALGAAVALAGSAMTLAG